MPRNFNQLLEAQWQKGHFVCVGLDPEYTKLPKTASLPEKVDRAFLSFNQAIIDATHDLVCAYKPNSAFYEAHGSAGLTVLHETIHYIHQIAPDVPVILDAKRGDIGNTNLGYVQEAFDFLQADAITLHPYLGQESLKPFLERQEKGIILLCRTSNSGSAEFQELLVGDQPLYQIIAQRIAEEWNTHGNCAVVAGATYPEELAQVREIIGNTMPILIPGIGAQGGDLKKTVQAGKNRFGTGIIISVSRSVLFASQNADFAEAARHEVIKLNEAIRQI